MAFSQVGIVNMGLDMLGVARISSIDDDSTQAIKAKAAWEYLRNEVLEARNWKFATTRVALAQNATSPASGYTYAYTIPTNFLRLVDDDKDDPAVYPLGRYANSRVFVGYPSSYVNYQSSQLGYKLETLPDGTKVLVTNYDNTAEDLYIRYIRSDISIGNYSATFCHVLACRIAWHLAYTLTESTTKREEMKQEYFEALNKADGINRASDWIQDETGSTDWEDAGR
jgi:hypothetical protein